MSRIPLVALSASLLVLSVACAESGSGSQGTGNMFVTDTLQNVFSVSCSTALCTLTPTNPELKPVSCDNAVDATDAFVLFWGTRILTAHAVSVPSSGSIAINGAEPAHPIACASEADCLPGLFDPDLSCYQGLCQQISAAVPMRTLDVVALCQADIPWPVDNCPYLTDPTFASRMAKVAALCGSAALCSQVPSDCRQPALVVPGLDASAAPTPVPVDGGAGGIDSGS